MSTPRRRSSRLRSQTPQKDITSSLSPIKLSTLVERDETPECGLPQSNLAEVVTSLRIPTSTLPGNDTFTFSLQTPTSTRRMRPSYEEMHPSHCHSTAKKLASCQRNGTTDHHVHAQLPGNIEKAMNKDYTPSSFTLPAQNPFSSPTFDFHHKRPSSDLSTEAQRMMDEVREQAARIKGELAAQRDEQLCRGGEEEALYNAKGRKIATPQGKVGRFSDVHMEQFKKMNSIANHPSSFRADPTRFPAVPITLKRSSSKAGLNNSEETLKCPPTTKSEPAELSEEPSSAVKRFKHRHEEEVAARPSSTGSNSERTQTTTPSIQRSKSGIPMFSANSSFTAPTKASIFRSQSVKSLQNSPSLIPSLLRSSSTKTLPKPTMNQIVSPKTAGTNNYRNAFVQRLTSVKSILRRPTLRFPEEPGEYDADVTATATKVATSPLRFDIDKALPDVPQHSPSLPANPVEKRTEFANSPAVSPKRSMPASPGTPSPTKMFGGYSVLNTAISYPAIYMEPGNVSPARKMAKIRASVAGPHDFTFRSEQTLDLESTNSTPTIRRVRASDVSGLKPAQANMLFDLPSVPHGLSNKKRKRAPGEEITGEDKENRDNGDQLESPSKRTKTTFGSHSNAQSTAKMPPSSRIPKRKDGKAVLSMSRLSALAKPKERK